MFLISKKCQFPFWIITTIFSSTVLSFWTKSVPSYKHNNCAGKCSLRIKVSTLHKSPDRRLLKLGCKQFIPWGCSKEPFIFLFIYLSIFWHFKFNVDIFFSKWCSWQKKHKFSIFFRAWNSAQVVSIICWRSVYSFKYEWNFELPLQIFVSTCWLCKID